MIKNYFKIAWRNLSKHKSNAFINIAGLTVGFAAFLLIFLVIRFQQSFDNFHANKNDIYRVVRYGRESLNREYRTGVPIPVTMTLRKDLPQLKNAAAIMGMGNTQVNVVGNDGSVQKKFKENAFVAEPQFFKIFNFPLAVGNIETALNEPNTVLLTRKVAAKYFGDWKLAMDKTIRIFDMSMKVTGVLDDPPVNTDFPLAVVVSYQTLVVNTDMTDWGSINDDNYCLVQLQKDQSPADVDKLLARFVDAHIKPINPGYMLGLQSLGEVHYDARYGNFTGRTFSKDLIWALSLIAIFLLVIACVNFINLTTAQAVNRAREVGVRKVLGSGRSQLITQFLGETALLVLVALAGAAIIVFICAPLLGRLLETELSASVLFSSGFLLVLPVVLLAVVVLSGFYPALVLSAFKSAEVLKGSGSRHGQTGILLRRGLVAFQFVIAQALIIGTLVVASQMDYFSKADMGFRKDAVVYADFPGDSLSRTKIDLLNDDLRKLPGVENVSFSIFTPASNSGGWATDLRLPGNHTQNPDMIIGMKPADTSFFNLYNLTLVAGRKYFASDTMREFVVNETVVKRLGIRNPQEAIGKLVNVNGKVFPIVGVVKDYHVASLRDPIGPIVMTTMKNNYGTANIRVKAGKAKEVIAAMEKIWGTHYPAYVFEYNFLDQSIAAYYKQEEQISQLYKIFSGIAIFISCLGLYGLVSFMAVQRRKEIGIRKVLGAPVRDIVVIMSKEFTLLIAIAFLIASPIAWYFMRQWLDQYTYRINLGLSFFAITIVGSLCIAWLTVGYTAIKAAVANPVKSLRTE